MERPFCRRQLNGARRATAAADVEAPWVEKSALRKSTTPDTFAVVEGGECRLN
jgi:hypothetical protein